MARTKKKTTPVVKKVVVKKPAEKPEDASASSSDSSSPAPAQKQAPAAPQPPPVQQIKEEVFNPPVAKTPPSTNGVLMEEAGTTGLRIYSGMIAETWNAELRWPQAWIVYERIRRTDPEIGIVKNIFSALAPNVRLNVKLNRNATDDDKRFQQFLYECIDDLEGGFSEFLSDCVSTVPFFGWGWWEAPACIRNPDWRPPVETEWRSQFKDNLLGVRRLSYRHPSRFERWDVEPPPGEQPQGRVRGLYQVTDFGQRHMWLRDSLHITFGDTFNPEGLATLEAVYRLERIKYALEVIQGIGFEHSAGHVKFSSKQKLTPDDKTHIRAAARAVTSAQEGNYIALPEHIDADMVDANFAAAQTILEAIRYYGILKLQIFNMQWVAMSTTSGDGSYAAHSDSSAGFYATFNSMIGSFVRQFDRQIATRLYRWNKAYFPNISRRPFIEALPLEKDVDLTALGTFVKDVFGGIVPITSQDIQSIRKKSGFLPDVSTDESTEPEDQNDDQVKGIDGKSEGINQVNVNKNNGNQKQKPNKDGPFSKTGSTIDWDTAQSTEHAIADLPPNSGFSSAGSREPLIMLSANGRVRKFIDDRSVELAMSRSSSKSVAG